MRRLSTLAVAALAVPSVFVLAGCSPQLYTTQGPVSTEPIVIDQAMQQRADWEPVTAAFENGQTFNPTTGFGYRPSGYGLPYAYSATDLGTFAVNVIAMPYTIYQQWDGVLSGGVILPPSYTANPPLPPSMQAPNAQAPSTQPTE